MFTILSRLSPDHKDAQSVYPIEEPYRNSNRRTREHRPPAVQLLIEQVTFHAADGEVEITFRPGGVRMLAEESPTKETA